MRAWVLMSLTLAAIAATLFFLRVKKEPPSSPRLQVADVLAGGETAGFARATSPRKFVFPADHGPHPDFRTEWWYVTGNLTFASGERFGIQLTFFRSTLQAYTTAAASQWRTNQIFMAHFAVTDVRTQRFYAYERFERGANGLAGAAGHPSSHFFAFLANARKLVSKFNRPPVSLKCFYKGMLGSVLCKCNCKVPVGVAAAE